MVQVAGKEDVALLREMLKKKCIRISEKKIKTNLDHVARSQEVFPLIQQRALLIHLLNIYDTTNKKEVIILDELGDKKIPVTVVLGALAEDWPGMSNSILGIIHHGARNVLFIKGFTLEFEEKIVGVVILCFKITSTHEYEDFLVEKKDLVKKIREASIGSVGKYLLLEDETVKFEIYNDIVKRIKMIYKGPDIDKIIGEKGEALKFVSSRSREYLAERKITDLASLIIDNFSFQEMIRRGKRDEIIKIENFKTRYEKLTGITFVCKEILISVEDFLKTLNYIVPDHVIKHHRSFVTVEGTLNYRLEIVDRHGKPLKADVIKSIEKSLDKLVRTSLKKKFSRVKAIGGFEHYARAIIPFLMDELKRTGMTQVFINADKKTDFSIDIKLVVVSHKTETKRIFRLISKLEGFPGIEINSTIPPKYYKEGIEINIFKLNVSLAEFSSIPEIFDALKAILKEIYGDIRDFDQGFREIDMHILDELLNKLGPVSMSLVRDIFFSFDELYRIEIPFDLLYEVIKLCSKAVEKCEKEPRERMIFKYKNLKDLNRTIFVISFGREQKFLSKIIKKLENFHIYFTKIERDQRTCFIMILSKDKRALDLGFIMEFRDSIQNMVK